MIQLKEKEAEPNVPVPLHNAATTVEVPPEDAAELSTVTTEVLNLAVAVVVPPNKRPVRV